MRDVEKMIAIGLVWGVTNSVMRKGALIWDQKLKKMRSSSSTSSSSSKLHHQLLAVPVTNATTFAATAVSAMILGEETRIAFALSGFENVLLSVARSMDFICDASR
ncbi:hypothetical protein C5167_018689 [Papaver somniferum]|uniref:Transmembrane protein 234 homolog n=1 Tax=Papaver somniferum TaxID=3469 RepID=A0A4Y7INL1_PAPSO|nr:hypothetical protein C5167_018689 [Papaver somniferum]